jgi:hypothetical protein
MKKHHYLKVTSIFSLLLLFTFNGYAQITGTNMGTAINAGNLTTPFSDTRNNTGYGNDIGQASEDIYYTFTLAANAEVSISHCGSGFDTYMHLLNSSGSVLASNDDNGPLCTGLQSSIKMTLATGTYFVVSEGYSSYTGNITTQISIPPTDPLRDKLNAVFAHVDKSQVPTGFLEDYAVPLIPLDVFNGALTDSNRLDMVTWREVYATLHSSRIFGANPLPSLPTVNNNLIANYGGGPIPIPILVANYDYLDPALEGANLMYVQNEQLYDVPGRGISPYGTRFLFAATPYKNHAATGTPSFVFNPGLVYNTSGKTVGSIQVDFGDGQGYRNVAWNIALHAFYTTVGSKLIKIKLNFTDNTTSECYSDFEVTELSSNSAARYFPNANIIQNFNRTTNHSGGNLFIRYSRNNTFNRIRKPLIIVEGVDYSSIAPEIQGDNYTFIDVIRNINNARNALFDFNNSLDDTASYDLVFLDFNHGSDDIVRNAALLQEVITWVNNEKAATASTQQNVVIGISMGGLVARYCLANMTKQNIPTGTRQLFTQDSPHRGANSPLGVQFLTMAANEVSLVQGLNWYDLIPALEQAKIVINAPASQQMLILRATNGTGGVANNTFIDNIYQPMITFPSTGPQPAYQVRAISLGSQCGIGSLNPGTELVRTEGKFFISPKPWIKRRTFKIDVVVNALPTFGTVSRISRLQIRVQRTLYSAINISINLTNKEANSPAGALTWDGAPGGTQSIAQQAGARIPSVNFTYLPFINLTLNTPTLAGDFCFVPTVSALDIDNITQGTLYGTYVDGIAAAGTNSRTDEFISQEQIVGTTIFNQRHPFFVARSAEWTFREMEERSNNNLNCSDECTTDRFTIAGPASFCSSASFQLNGVPAGSNVTWSASPTLFSPSSGPGSSFTTTATTNSGSGTITFIIATDCGPKTVTRNVTVGNDHNFSISGPSSVCPGQTVFFSIDPVNYPGVLEYDWLYPTGWTYLGGENSPWLDIQAPYSNGFGGGTIGLKIRTECGWTDTPITKYVQENYYGCSSSSYSYSISPNPADGYVEVKAKKKVKSKDGKEEITENFDFTELKDVEVKLYDKFSKLLKTGKLKEGKLKFSTNNLPNDIYILHIINGQEVIQEKIIVAH